MSEQTKQQIPFAIHGARVLVERVEAGDSKLVLPPTVVQGPRDKFRVVAVGTGVGVTMSGGHVFDAQTLIGRYVFAQQYIGPLEIAIGSEPAQKYWLVNEQDFVLVYDDGVSIMESARPQIAQSPFPRGN